MHVTPTGRLHEVGVNDLFFSTTDARGVIEQANEVFVRLSRHPRHELVGAPHNIIRHPDMPGGAFKLVWDMLLAGEATCAYVKNLAGDGSAYWAFATITPLDGGYLSVRARPCVPEVVEALTHAYSEVRSGELLARSSGAGAAKAARIGADLLTEQLGRLGFADYPTFVHVALPAEISARAEEHPHLIVPDDVAGLRRVMLDAVTDIEHRVRMLEAALAAMQGQAGDLGDQVMHTVTISAGLRDALRQAGVKANSLSTRAPVVANAVPALTQQCDRVGRSMATVLAHVEDMLSVRQRLLFSVAMSQVQSEMVARFVLAMIDGTEDAATSDQAIRSLIRALHVGLDGLAEALARTVDQSTRMRAEIEEAGDDFGRTRQLLGHWRGLIDRYGLADELAPHMPALDHGLQQGDRQLQALAQSADDVGQAALGFDLSIVREELQRVLACLRAPSL